MTRWHALGLLLAASTALGADDALRQQVEQSVRLGARLVGDAATGQRIAASGHTRAAALLEDSRLHLARAEKALAEGDLPTARQEAEEALLYRDMQTDIVQQLMRRLAAVRSL